MAHVVLEERLRKAGLDDRVIVSSAGTGGWHTGDPMDRRAADVLAAAGDDPTRHVARRFTTDWFSDNDLILAMDASNHADISDLSPDASSLEKLQMFRDYDPDTSDTDNEVPDPYYDEREGFRSVLTMIERTVDGLVDDLKSKLQ